MVKEDNEKKVNEMTEKEILRKQMELLSENSSVCNAEELPALTVAMCILYQYLT